MYNCTYLKAPSVAWRKHKLEGQNVLKLLRAGFIVALLTLAGMSLAVLKTLSIATAAIAVIVGGTKSPVPLPTPAAPGSSPLSEWIASRTDSQDELDYPAQLWPATGLFSLSLDESSYRGLTALHEIIRTTPGAKMPLGLSQGSVVITRWLQTYADDPDAPPASELEFVLLANPDRPNGGMLARFPKVTVPIMGATFWGPTPETQYKTLDVVREYDGFADFPEDPLNLLAVANALLGVVYLHSDYSGVDIDSPDNLVQHSGNTTYVMVPTERLPLLQPIRDLLAVVGRTETPLLDAIEPTLKALIDTGYDRSTVTHTPFRPGSSLTRLPGAMAELAKDNLPQLKPQPEAEPVADQTADSQKPKVRQQLKPELQRSSLSRSGNMVSPGETWQNGTKSSAIRPDGWKPGDAVNRILNRLQPERPNVPVKKVPVGSKPRTLSTSGQTIGAKSSQSDTETSED